MATLSQHRRKPTLQPLDARGTPLKDVVVRYKECRTYLASLLGHGGDMARPEAEAVSFYLHNAAYARVAQAVEPEAPLGQYEPLLDQYHAVMRSSALRMFYYLLLICTRESRHLHNSTTFYTQLEASHGAACVNFTRSIKGSSSDGAVAALLTKTPDVSLGVYTDYLYTVFQKGASYNLFSGGYGGVAWAEVAKVLRNFVHGVLSAELMLDTAFTLAHNNGPIFNKGLLFHHYDSYELTRILDVQRAGMIPQYVASINSPYLTPQHRTFWAEAAALLGDGFTGAVDWHVVQALGAKQLYVTAKPKPTPTMKVASDIGLTIPGFTFKAAPRKAKGAK